MARVADLTELARAAVEAARDHEAVEAYAEEARRTEVTAHKGEVEGLTFAESRGVGIRLIANGRLGYAYAADPSLEEVREALARARESAELATEDEFNALPPAEPIEPISALFRQDQAALVTERKVSVALDLEHLAQLVEAETHQLPGPDECEAADHGLVVVPVARCGSLWPGQQSKPLVEPDRRAGDSRLAGYLTNPHSGHCSELDLQPPIEGVRCRDDASDHMGAPGSSSGR